MTEKGHKSAPTLYLGLGATYHDPALAIINERGDVLFAEALERPLQYKRALNCEPDNPFELPRILSQLAPNTTRFIVATNWMARRPWYEHLAKNLSWLTPKGILRYQGRQLTTCLETWELNHMQALQHHALKRVGLNLARIIRTDYPGATVHFRHYDHHLCHAALAAFGSPFEASACAVIDSYGEEGSLAFFDHQGGQLTPISHSRGPQSLGFLYMKLTELCGFNWMAGEEWKVMGLASYGQLDEELMGWLRAMIQVEGLSLIQDRASFFQSLKKLERRRRHPDEPPEAAANLAFTGQQFFTEIVHQLLNALAHRSGLKQLTLAGGCALNSVMNGQIINATPFESLHVPSAPADDGTALGAALLAFSEDHRDHPPRKSALTPFLGSRIHQEALERFKAYSGLEHEDLKGSMIYQRTADLIAQGAIIGWVQGAAEFGPRALGHRSILADPRSLHMMDKINESVKFRERFRPYAPAILHEHGPDYFEDYQDTPYMERTLRFRPEMRDRVPAVVHVDGSGRLQSVTKTRNPDFYPLIEAFYAKTQIPILLNTSFNIMGKPMVHSVEDAFAVFLGSGLDALVIGQTLFRKSRDVQ
ncbi:MAG: nodulation protein nolNO [Gammaproteobacteria bacterium]|nr:nodulation protein nolNO [Gammaproteobacteria bacterium]